MEGNAEVTAAAIKRYFADRIYLTAQDRIPAAMLMNATTNACLDMVSQSLAISLATYMHGLPLEKIHIDREFPATWWDAFKLRWFPTWAQSRWPAKMERIYVDQKIYHAVCPHISEQNQGTHLQWLSMKQDELDLLTKKEKP